jgi:hypothetical protein
MEYRHDWHAFCSEGGNVWVRRSLTIRFLRSRKPTAGARRPGQRKSAAPANGSHAEHAQPLEANY